MSYYRLFFSLVVMVLFSACTPPKPHDYSAFLNAKPRSLLVLPPINNSPDVNATAAIWTHATQPLAEAGYYVLPITLVDQTLRFNGIQTAQDAHNIPLPKLRKIFGADAVVFLTVKEYGTQYAVIASDTRVTVSATIVSLVNGTPLWSGQARAASSEERGQQQGGLVGLLVGSLVTQIIESSSNTAYRVGERAQYRLLGLRYGQNYGEGVLPGPRLPPAKSDKK